MDVFDVINNIFLKLFNLVLTVIVILLAGKMLLDTIKTRLRIGRIKLAARDKACGIVFGMILTFTGPKVVYSPINDEGSVLVWGTSGSGKTDGILRPTISSLGEEATTFCIDISGDIVNTVNIKRKVVFGPSAENSAVYDVFSPVDRIMQNTRTEKTEDFDRRNALVIEQLTKIASQLEPRMQDGDAEGAVVYFTNGGHDIIAASLIAGYFTGMDFPEICEKIYQSGWKELFNWIDETGFPEAMNLIGQFQGIKEENISGCMGNAKNVVGGIASSRTVKQFLHRPCQTEHGLEPSFTPNMLETHSAFYVVNDGTDFELYATLTRLVISQVMEYLQQRDLQQLSEGGKNPHMILLTLDELSSLNIAKEVTEAAKKYRKKKVRILALTQSIADLDLMTQRGNTTSRAIIDNFPYRMILSAQDPVSQSYFADCVGHHLIKSEYRSYWEYWIQPEEFGRLDNHLVLVHPKGHMILGKNYYHKTTMKIIINSLLDLSIFKWRIR